MRRNHHVITFSRPRSAAGSGMAIGMAVDFEVCSKSLTACHLMRTFFNMMIDGMALIVLIQAGF